MSHRGLRNGCFMFIIFYFIHHDYPALGAQSVINHLREGSDKLNHIEEDVEESEAGFDLDEEDMKKFHIWPNGVIPYYVDDYSFDKVLRDTIRAFLEHASGITGLNFLELLHPPDDDSRWVFFINRQELLGCAEHPFKSFTSKGVQKVVLGYDCLKTDHGLAEIILTLAGVPPQHNAPDRDQYIKINKKNILPDKMHLFKVLRNDEWLFHDIEYDFKSAGHYDSHKFTMNGKATIIPTDRTLDVEIGQGKCFSYKDIKKIKMLYNYIISKHKASVRLPECLKIFSPGQNFRQFKPKSSNKITPRRKPNKYLGIKDKNSGKLGEKAESKEIDNNSSSSEKQTHKPLEESTEHVEQQQNQEKSNQQEDQANITEPIIKSGENDENKNERISNENIENVSDNMNRSHTLKSKIQKNKDRNKNLLDLSDYGTGEMH